MSDNLESLEIRKNEKVFYSNTLKGLKKEVEKSENIGTFKQCCILAEDDEENNIFNVDNNFYNFIVFIKDLETEKGSMLPFTKVSEFIDFLDELCDHYEHFYLKNKSNNEICFLSYVDFSQNMDGLIYLLFSNGIKYSFEELFNNYLISFNRNDWYEIGQ